MAITSMVAKTLHNKGVVLISIIVFSFFIFQSSVLALTYNSGLYNTGYYSDTAPLVPTATPIGGTYYTTQSVVLTATGSTSIRYSTVSTPADCSSGTLYSTPIPVSASLTIYARACNSLGNSTASTIAYIIDTTPLVVHGSSIPLSVLQEMSDRARAQQSEGNTNFSTQKAFVFSKNLAFKMTSNDVQELQKYLNNNGFIVAKTGPGSKGNETTKFGFATKATLIKFQKANKISPAVGYFGPKTRSKIKELGL